MKTPVLYYMSKRGAGIARSVHSADECERLMKSLRKRGIDADLRVGDIHVGAVTDLDGSLTWWFDPDVFDWAKE